LFLDVILRRASARRRTPEGLKSRAGSELFNLVVEELLADIRFQHPAILRSAQDDIRN
jgi:hypothetical protein